MGRPNSVFNEREQAEFHVCKAIEDNPYMQSRKSNIIEFESAQVESTDLTEIIEEDKRYGTFQPFNGEYADFRIEFRTVATDPEKELKASTLMYHYYPISNSANRLRGLCVINKDFFWTTAGGSWDMHYIDPEHYPEPNSGYGGKTYDLDQVYTHEVLHGLGLPHSKTAGNVMSPNYGIMAEWMSEEDIARIQAKYGSRNISESRIKRWLKWLKIASER